MSALAETAARLRAAYRDGPIPPLRGALEPLDAVGAYAVQSINTTFWQATGRRIVGRKAGLTARAVQRQLGVEQPDYGVLFADMRVPDGGVLAAGACLQPKVEGEIAFTIGQTLDDPAMDRDALAAAIASVHAAIEIVDSRIADWKISFADTVADNGSSAYFVFSDHGVPLAQADLFSAGMVLELDGEIASVGAAAAALGNPLNAALWLARTLAEQGDPLAAGDIVLAGALGPMVELAAGSHVAVTVGGIGRCSFTYDEPGS